MSAPAYGNTARAKWPAGVPLAYCHWWADPDEDKPEDEDDDGDLTRSECVTGCEPDGDDSRDDEAADRACDRWERDRDARASQ